MSIDVTDTNARSLQKTFTAPANFTTAEVFSYKDAGKADLLVGDFTLLNSNSHHANNQTALDRCRGHPLDFFLTIATYQTIASTLAKCYVDL